MDNLDNDQTQEQEVAEQTSEPVEQTSDNSQEVTEPKQNREGRYSKLEKSHNEYRSFSDRKINELSSRLKEYETKYKPLEPFLGELQKTLEDKRQEQLAQQYQTNPLEVQKMIAQQIAQQQMQPYQQQMETLMNEKTVSDTINYLQNSYGEEAFKSMQPEMASLLTEVKETKGQEVADLLAREPDALFQMSVGRAYITEMKRRGQAKQVGNANQQKAVSFANGVSRPNSASPKGSSDYENMPPEQLKKLAMEELSKRYQK